RNPACPRRRARPPPAGPPPRDPRTSDWYRVSDRLPSRVDQPARVRGYRETEPHPLYRTSNQSYGSRAPTVHEMPSCYRVTSHAFTAALAPCGMYRDNGLNTRLDRSRVTGPGNFITAADRLDFQPSYKASGPSFC
uniref:CI116 protein n=1 Tax=Nothoprocta perdicaria TaxID=30464 RepID=A0A8C6ZMW1_NOTPE